MADAPRLPARNEDAYDDAQRAFVAALRAGPRGPNMAPNGPFAVWLHAPALGALAQQLGAYCRYGTSLSARQSEFAILCVAHHWRAQFEWAAHARIAAEAGVSAETIEAVRAGKPPAGAAADELAIHAVVEELFRTQRVSDAAYAKAHAFLGDAGMVELTGIVGYYTLVAMSLNVFLMPPPTGQTPAFPES
ncbi:MAG: carboxymuconolactone decarboxylase family protein [Hyphomonadaceae bacterium]